MKAVALTARLPDQPGSLTDIELPVPVASGRDLLVAVKAVSVNPLDNRARRPKAQAQTAPRVLGWDAAGIVVAVGADVTMFRAGDSVYYAGDLGRQGSNAEYQLVDERIAGMKPRSVSFEAAAALPLTGLTAWEALFERLGIARDPAANAGKTILIIGAAGGVGSMAVQLAARVAGLTVIATASRIESHNWVRHLGARHVVNHHEDIPAQLKEIGYPLVDFVLMLADTDSYLPIAAKVIAPQGGICAAVESTRPIDFAALWDKSVFLAWVMVFTRVEYRTADLDAHGAILNELARLVDAHVIDSTLTDVITPINADNLRHAHAELERGGVFGKIALSGF